MHPKVLSILSGATMVLALLLAACGGGAAGTTTSTGNKNPADIRVGFVSATSSQNFASEMAAGAQYAANQFHVSAQIVAPPTIDPQAEVNLFTNLTRTATDGIAVETLSPDLFVRPEANAVSQGIPIIAVDTVPPAAANITTYVGNDNITAGAMLATGAIARLPKDAKGSVVIGDPFLPTEYRASSRCSSNRDRISRSWAHSTRRRTRSRTSMPGTTSSRRILMR